MGVGFGRRLFFWELFPRLGNRSLPNPLKVLAGSIPQAPGAANTGACPF
jgi:hypothetical protein